MKRSLFLSVAPIALISIATPASAQTDTSSQQPAEAQTQEGATTAKPDSTTEDTGASAIVVTGIRRSLQSAQSIKKNSDAIVDSIVAEDIGKLPDYTAAESIARIAGVQVDRYSDEANRVLIRGLPDVATTYNGREIFTAELRRVQLQDFPAQAIAQMDVYKSGTADIVEPGLAGLVNVRTRRPFDFKGRVIAGGLRGTYNDQSRKFDPQGNVLISERWDTGIGEIGFLANVTYAQSQYYNGVRYNGTWIRDSGPTTVTTAGVGQFRMPNNIGLYNDGGRRFRPSGNFAAQWAPNADLQFYAEGLYQGYRGRGYADNFDIPLIDWGPNGRPTLSNVELVEGTDQAASLTHTGGTPPQGWRGITQDYTNTYQVATGAKWHRGRLTLATDLAYSWSEYFRDRWNVDFGTKNVGNVDVAFNQDGGSVFSLPGWDASDPANYIFRGYWNETYGVKGNGLQWRADADYDTGLSFLSKVQAGVRLTNRVSQQVKYGSRYAWVLPSAIPLADLPAGDLEMTIDPFRGSAQGFTSYLSFPRDQIYENREAIRQFTYQALQQLAAANPGDQGWVNTLNTFSTEDVVPDPLQSWKGKENTYAGYLQGKYAFPIGPVDVDGVVGVRVVKTEGTTRGVSNVCLRDTPTSTTCTSTHTPRSAKQDYTDVLPNFSMRVKFSPELQLRLAYTKSRTKPEFRDMNPALFINPIYYDPNVPRTPGSPDYAGSSGNPDLKPFTSNNYDASLEYYFSKTGYVSAALFRRDLQGFLTWVTVRPNDPTYGVLQLNEPINAGDGKIKGFEVNAQTFLDFLPRPFNGFGVAGNVTYLKGKTRYPNGYDPDTDTFSGTGQFMPIPGLSKWTYNLTGFYEKGGITARVSYNWRSNWVNWYSSDQNGQYSGNSTRARDRLDGSISYDVNKNFTVTADISNILARPFRNYTQYARGFSFPQDVRDEGRYYGFGVRFRFGE